MFEKLLRLLILFLAPLLFYPPSGHPQSASIKLNRLEWILGSWKLEATNSYTIEKWRRLSDRTFEGTSMRFSKSTQEVTFREDLLLVEMGEEVFYIPKVWENEYPVPFKMTSLEKRRISFENPSHDFPQMIIYILNPDGSMKVTVSGMEGGEEKSIEFKYIKQDPPQ